jgi:hypothetical protein
MIIIIIIIISISSSKKKKKNQFANDIQINNSSVLQESCEQYEH